MRISNVAHRGVVGVQTCEPMVDAVRVMLSEDVGALVVYEGEAMVGIITERDVVRAFAETAGRADATVGEYMTSEPAVVTPSDDSLEAAIRMIELGVRHLPVVEFGEPVGMVSARDLLALEAWPAASRA